MTKDNYQTSAKENIGMFSNMWNDRNSFIYLSLFKRQVRPMFSGLLYPCDDWKLFCEPVSTR